MVREELAEQGDHSDSLACARCDGAGQKAGIKYLSRIEERVGPTLSRTKVRTQIYYLPNETEWTDIGCTPGNYPKVFAVPRTHETQKTTFGRGNC